MIAVTIDQSIEFHDRLAAGLRERGCDVHIVSSPGPRLTGIADVATPHGLPMRREPSPLRDMISLGRWISIVGKLRPDVVIAGTPKASMLGMIAARIWRVPVRLYYVHGMRLETARGLARWILLLLERITARNATGLIAVSPSLRDLLVELKISSLGKIDVVGSGSAQGVDLERFRPVEGPLERAELRAHLGLSGSLPIVGFVGRLVTEKGVGEFRDALINLWNEGRRFEALIVGGAEDALGAGVADDLRRRGIGVMATGHIEDVAQYMRAMDILCLPTYREGLGNVILEAFASGVPVVGSRVTGVVDLVKHDETGLLVQPRDAIQLATAIRTMLSDAAMAERLRRNGCDLVRRCFDQRDVIRAHMRLLFPEEFGGDRAQRPEA